MNSKRLENRAFVWVLLVLVLLGAWILSPFWDSILVGIVLAVLFYPFHRRFLKWTRHRNSLASVLSVLSIILLVLIPIGILVTLLTAQIATVVQHFPKSLSMDQLSGFLGHLQAMLQTWIDKFEALLGTKFDLVAWTGEGLQKVGQYLAKYSPAVVAKTADFFFRLFIMLLVLFYLFRDGKDWFEKLLKLSPVKDQYERQMAGEIQNTIYGVFYGSFLTSAVQAVLATIAYYIASIPGALLWGVMTFFVSFVPIVGTAGVIIPLILYLVFQGQYGYAIFLGIYGVVVIGFSDNLLKPLLIRSNIHSALLFLSLFGGMVVIGPLGILLGPIIMALLSATLRIYEKDYLGEAEVEAGAD